MSALVLARGLAIAGRLSETSLELESGQVTCLIGPNGSGKTSLLHALAGISPSKGEVLIGGVSPKGLSPDARQRLFSYLPASREIRWPLTAGDLIALGLPSGTDASALIADLELAALVDRRIDRLSTGERSRVLIARALAADPQLLLLDEPTANLDPLWQLKLMERLRRRARDGAKAVLVAVHDLEMARAFADRLIIVDGGRIAADGEPRALLRSPHMPAIFGIERTARAGVRPRPREDPRSWR